MGCLMFVVIFFLLVEFLAEGPQLMQKLADAGAAAAIHVAHALGPAAEHWLARALHQAIQSPVERRDPTKSAASSEAVALAQAATQARINECIITDVVDKSLTFRQRMPLCAGKAGAALETCLRQTVLGDDASAVNQAENCSLKIQDQMQTIGKGGVYVWLKGQICGFGVWIGLKPCQD